MFPSRQTANDALNNSFQFTHPMAPDIPTLSPKRCEFMCDWFRDRRGTYLFSEPVDWETMGLMDYPSFVSVPMDLHTLKCFTEDDNFEFDIFLRMSRLIWANAAKYNPPTNGVHAKALELGNAFEEKIREMQENSYDDDIMRLSYTCTCLLSTVTQHESAELFVPSVFESVDMDTYLSVVAHPACLSRILSAVQEFTFTSRYDVLADIFLVFHNAVLFHGEQSPIGTRALAMKEFTEQMFDNLQADIDKTHFIPPSMRSSFLDMITCTSISDPQTCSKIIAFIGSIFSNAVADNGITVSVTVDALNITQFASCYNFANSVI